MTTAAIPAHRAIDPPYRMRKLPRNKAGYVIPWFVGDDAEGHPDFRLLRPDYLAAAKDHLCMLCGQPMGRWCTFVVGPMCAVNRVSAEPPSHLDCATYAVQVCPFLSVPKMVRRETGLEGKHIPGIPIVRNPGVALLWTVARSQIRPFDAAGTGVLFDIGNPPHTATWWAQSRAATREEVLESLTTGMPALAEAAAADGPRAFEELQRRHQAALQWLPQS